MDLGSPVLGGLLILRIPWRQGAGPSNPCAILIWLWVKNRYPKWKQRKHRLKPVIPCRLNFNSYPIEVAQMVLGNKAMYFGVFALSISGGYQSQKFKWFAFNLPLGE